MPDLAEAMELSRLAGWNQCPQDWCRLLALAPRGCFCVELEGRVVATATVVCYQRQLAWIGMVLTHPEYRRRGFAKQLVMRAIEYAKELGVPSIKLDATELGRPLYESLGFREEQTVERWVRTRPDESGTGVHLEFNGNGVLDEVFRALDREAYGYDRASLLSSFSAENPKQLLTALNGYLICRPGLMNAYLGPCAARSHETAKSLLVAALAQNATAGWFWDLLPSNDHAVKIAEDLGFKRARSLTRMVSGTELRGREALIYAVAGFELG